MVKAVSEEGTITDAARKLNLSQSALSHQLRNLEEELKISVFNRINKKLVLTDAGRIILKSSTAILNEINCTKRKIDKLVDGQTGTIRLSTECYTSYQWFPPIIKAFKKQYPDVEVEIEAIGKDAVVSTLLNGELDVALVYHNHKDPNINYVNLFDDELVVVLNADNPLSKKEVIMPSDFKERTLVTTAKDFEASATYQMVFKRYGISPANLIYVQLTGAAMEMVRADLGITVMPRWIVNNYLENGELKQRPLTRNRLVRKWRVASLKDPLAPSYIEHFIELLKSNEQNIFESGS